MTEKKTLAILGGTGEQGGALALRWARAGYVVVIGSREAAKAHAKAQEIAAKAPGAQVSGLAMEAAARAGEIVILAVPWAAHKATIEQVKDAVQGKIVVDVTVPLVPPRVARVQLPPEGSAAVAAQQAFGPGVKIVSAFQNVAAHALDGDGDGDAHCDVLVCGDDKDSRGAVVALARAAGLRAYHAGALANSAATEALTSLLIFLNGRYHATTGIRLTGLPDDPA